MALAGAAAGAAVALVPAILRVRFKVDDVVSSLLLNSIIFYALMALIEGPWKDPFSGYPISPPIEDGRIPGADRRHRAAASRRAGGAARRARRLVRDRAHHARLQDQCHRREPGSRALWRHPRPERVLVSTALLSGALAGLAGVGEVGGVHFQVMSDISPGYGYSGIVIAMLARLNPLGVVPAAIFLAAVMTGAEAMSRATGVPAFLSDVIQGTALLAMLVALLFTAYRVRRVGAAS